MPLATDSTAGERERGSIEALLVNPAPREAIAAGKWLAGTLTAMLSVVVSGGLLFALFQYIPLQDLGIRFHLGQRELLGTLAIVLPLCPLIVGIQMYVATFAKSFKEAQSYLSFLMMAQMVPGMMATMNPAAAKAWWMYYVPWIGAADAPHRHARQQADQPAGVRRDWRGEHRPRGRRRASDRGTVVAREDYFLDVDDNVRGRPAALIAAAAVARAVVHLRAQPVGAGRAERGGGLRLEEFLGVAAVHEVDRLGGDLHVTRAAILLPQHLDVAALLRAPLRRRRRRHQAPRVCR